jgi:hypothetical protein
MVTELQSALTTKQRLSILSRIQHDLRTNSQVSDALMQSGLMAAVVTQLHLVVQRHGTSSHEVNELCHTIENISRTHRSIIETELSLPALVILSHCCIRWNAALPVMSIWYHLSSSSAGSLRLLQCREVMAAISQVMRETVAPNQHVYACNIPHRRLLGEVLGLLKNLTYHTDADGRRHVMELPGLISLLVHIPLSINDHDTVIRERLSALWRNWSLTAPTRYYMVQDVAIVKALHNLCLTNHAPVLRNICHALVSLSMDPDSTLTLVIFGDGMWLKVIHAFLTSTDTLLRKRTARLCRLWANNDCVGPIVIHASTLMQQLSHTAFHDVSHSVRKEALEAWTRFSALVHAPLPYHTAILDALVRLAQCPTTPAVVLARAVCGQAQHVQNRVLLVQRIELVNLMARIAVHADAGTVAQSEACQALAYLCAEPRNAAVLVHHAGVIEAWVVQLQRATVRRDLAVQAIVHLAHPSALVDNNNTGGDTNGDNNPIGITNEECCAALAQHATLLPALLQYASQAGPSPLKDQLKHVLVHILQAL